MGFKDTFNRYFLICYGGLRYITCRSDSNFERESLDVFTFGYGFSFDSGAGWLSNNSG